MGLVNFPVPESGFGFRVWGPVWSIGVGFSTSTVWPAVADRTPLVCHTLPDLDVYLP